MREQVKFCRSAPPAWIALWIVTTVIRPVSHPQFAVYVPYAVGPLRFAQNERIRFYQRFVEGRRLSCELVAGIRMILCEETWDDIPLGRKGENIELRPSVFVITHPPCVRSDER